MNTKNEITRVRNHNIIPLRSLFENIWKLKQTIFDTVARVLSSNIKKKRNKTTLIWKSQKNIWIFCSSNTCLRQGYHCFVTFQWWRLPPCCKLCLLVVAVVVIYVASIPIAQSLMCVFVHSFFQRGRDNNNQFSTMAANAKSVARCLYPT